METCKPGDKSSAVTALQNRLAEFFPDAGLSVDGSYGPGTVSVVKRFQKIAGLVEDGVAGPRTMAAMSSSGNLVAAKRVVEDIGALTTKDFEDAAKILGCEVEAVMAVSAVESRGRGFSDKREPKILLERHIAYRLISKVFGAGVADGLAQQYPQVVNKNRGGYTSSNGSEWDRYNMLRVTALSGDIKAIAIQSCSWGLFQIMGFNYAACGFKSPVEFFDNMWKSEGAQLSAFCRFIKSDERLRKAIISKDWSSFAKAYNGPAYDRGDTDPNNDYDFLLAQAYNQAMKRSGK